MISKSPCIGAEPSRDIASWSRKKKDEFSYFVVGAVDDSCSRYIHAQSQVGKFYITFVYWNLTCKISI